MTIVKNQLILLIASFALLTGFGQTLTIGKQVPSYRFCEQMHLGTSYWLNLYAEGQGGFALFDKAYEVVDLEQSTAHSSGAIKRRSERLIGEPINYFVEGAFIYELVRFVKPVATAKCQMGLIKRTISDFEQVGEIAWIGEYDFIVRSQYPNLLMRRDKSGITLLSGYQIRGDQQPFIARYDFDLKLLWKNTHEFLGNPDVTINGYSSNDKGQAIVELHFNNYEEQISTKKGKITPTALSFLIIQANGETELLAPQLKNMPSAFSQTDFHFDFDKQELTGLFLISELTDEAKANLQGEGYAYFRCGMDGKILAFHHQMFTYGDVYTTEAKEYAQRTIPGTVINDSDPFPRLKYPKLTTILQENGHLLLKLDYLYVESNTNSKQNPPLSKSTLLLLIDDTGSIQWKQFIIRPDEEVKAIVINPLSSGPAEEYCILKENRLYYFNYAHAAWFNGGKYELPSDPKAEGKPVFVPSIMTIDCGTGELLSCKQLSPEVAEGFRFDQYFAPEVSIPGSNRDVYLRYTDKKGDNAQFVKVVLD